MAPSLNVPGLTGQVANVVLVAGAAQAGFTTTIRWQPEWRPRLDDNWLNGEVSTTGKLGGTNVTLSLKNEANRQGHWGPEQRFDGNGVLQFTRDEFARYYGDRPRLRAGLGAHDDQRQQVEFQPGRPVAENPQPGQQRFGAADERHRARDVRIRSKMSIISTSAAIMSWGWARGGSN